MSMAQSMTDYYPPTYTNQLISKKAVEVPQGLTIGGINVLTASDPSSGGSLSSPTVTATANNNITSVTLANVRLIQNGTDATLDGQAIVQGTNPNTAATSFNISLPNRTTVFSDVLSARGYIGGKDANLNGINNGVISSVKNGKQANIAFTMGGVSVPYYVDFTIKYTMM